MLQDDEGLEFDGIEDARELGARILAELVRDTLPGSINRELTIVVRDDAKEPLLRTRLVFETIWLQQGSASEPGL